MEYLQIGLLEIVPKLITMRYNSALQHLIENKKQTVLQNFDVNFHNTFLYGSDTWGLAQNAKTAVKLFIWLLF